MKWFTVGFTPSISDGSWTTNSHEIIVTKRIKAPIFLYMSPILTEEPSEKSLHTRTITKWPVSTDIVSVKLFKY